MQSFEYRRYTSLYDIFIINDKNLQNYLSKITSKQYIKELGFIKKDDIIEYYVEIFKNIEGELENILIELKSKLKSITMVEENVVPNYNNYDGHYGC